MKDKSSVFSSKVHLMATTVADYLIKINKILPPREDDSSEEGFTLSQSRNISKLELELKKASSYFFDYIYLFVSEELKKNDYCTLEIQQTPVGELESICTSAGVSLLSFPEFVKLSIKINCFTIKSGLPEKEETITIS